jgi:hypothetical protein
LFSSRPRVFPHGNLGGAQRHNSLLVSPGVILISHNEDGQKMSLSTRVRFPEKNILDEGDFGMRQRKNDKLNA